VNAPSVKTLLHVGCGPLTRADILPYFRTEGWREIRYDIDPGLKPDVVGSITDMSAVPDASVDAVYSSHNLEHVFPHEVGRALREFARVLRPDGFVVVITPDLQAACALIAQGRLLEPAYHTPQGNPVAPLDIVYGHRPATAAGEVFMAHKCGFTLAVLIQLLRQAGFPSAGGVTEGFALWVVARKAEMAEQAMRNFTMGILTNRPDQL
jgi:ubiquinone/menaquinone biosynthesis C-methylase UbiE